MAEVAAWPTYEAPEPDDVEKTRIYTTPPSRLPPHPPARQPSRPPTAHPSQPPHPPTYPSRVHAELDRERSAPPSGHPGAPPVEPERDATRPPPPAEPPAAPPAEPAQRPRQAERRREKGKSRTGLIAGGLAVAAVLVAAVAGWAYVEYWSGTPYLTAGAEPEANPATEPQEPEPQEPEPQEPEIQEPEIQEPEIQQPEAPEPRFTEADIRDHVTGHDGGDCYFAYPAGVGDGHAEIVGYGNRRTPFDALRDSIRARFGFDAAIDVRTVSDDQCVMVNALGRLAAANAVPVALDLSHSVLRSGGSLSGTISGLGDRHLSLLMVDNFGFVHDLAGYVTRDEGTASFAIDEMTTASQMDFEPQLVLSIASAEPLQSLDLTQSLPASDLVPSLLDEIAGGAEGLAADIGYFKFGS